MTRFNNITDAVSLSYESAEDLKQAADRYIILASGWNASSFIMKQEATRLLAEIMNVTVDMSIVVAGRGLTKSQGVLEKAEEYRNGINQQVVIFFLFFFVSPPFMLIFRITYLSTHIVDLTNGKFDRNSYTNTCPVFVIPC